MSFQTTDSKKEEFRKYLEKAGVLDALTKGTLPQWCVCYYQLVRRAGPIKFVFGYLKTSLEFVCDACTVSYFCVSVDSKAFSQYSRT